MLLRQPIERGVPFPINDCIAENNIFEIHPTHFSNEQKHDYNSLFSFIWPWEIKCTDLSMYFILMSFRKQKNGLI